MFPVFSNKLWLTFDAESLINPPLALRLYPLCVHYISSSLKLHKVFPKKRRTCFFKSKTTSLVLKNISYLYALISICTRLYINIYGTVYSFTRTYPVFLAGRTGIHRRVDRQKRTKDGNACDRRNRPWRYVRYQGVFQ